MRSCRRASVSARLRFLSQMRAVISGVLRRRKLKVEQLAAVDLATFGHLICGLYPSEIRRLSAHNLRSGTHSCACLIFFLFLCSFRGFFSNSCCCSAQLQDFNAAEGLGFSFFPPETAAWRCPSCGKPRCPAQSTRWRHSQAVCSDPRPLVQSALGGRKLSLKLGRWQVQKNTVSSKL